MDQPLIGSTTHVVRAVFAETGMAVGWIVTKETATVIVLQTADKNMASIEFAATGSVNLQTMASEVAKIDVSIVREHLAFLSVTETKVETPPSELIVVGGGR